MSKFMYSLRLGVDPKTWDKRKTDDLMKFVKEASIDDVNIIINSEELNQGHIRKEDIQPWLDCSVAIHEELKKEGVTLSLNPWTSLMHCDRGRKMDEEMGFQTIKDYQGIEALAVVCPGDLDWQEYLSDVYAMYAKIKPKYIWLDDDFRHFNHDPVEWGCFCEKHMEHYEKELGYSISQEEFVRRMLDPKEVHLERLVYLKTAQQEILNVAKKIQEKVAAVSPTTIVGLMSSEPWWHQVENRDWKKLFKNLAGEKQGASRPHLPAYNEKAGLHYVRDFNRCTRVVADMIEDSALLFPELENYMYSPYAKSNAFTQLQLETCATVGSSGVLFNFYDMMGNGFVEEYRHQEILKESKEFLNFLNNNRMDVAKLEGVKVLYAQDSVATRMTKEGTLNHLLPREFEWLALLGSFGVSCRPFDCKEVSKLEGDVVACSDQVLRNLSAEEIKILFDKNVMLVDGESVEILFERKLEYLIHAQSFVKREPHTGYQTYEEIVGDKEICGVQKARMTLMQQCGTYYDVQYDEKYIERVTDVFNEYGGYVGIGMVQSSKFFILPIAYHQDLAWDGQYVNYKATIIKDFIHQFTKANYIKNTSVVQMINDSNRLWVTNFSLDGFPYLDLVIKGWDQEEVQLRVVSRSKEEIVSCKLKDGVYRLNYPLKMFETIYIEKQ